MMKRMLMRGASPPGESAPVTSLAVAWSLCSAALLMAPAGCGPSPGGGSLDSQQAADTAVAGVEVQWSSGALEAQPRMDRLVRATPPELGYAPATTPWRAAEWMPAAAPDSIAGDTPGSTLSALAAALGWSDALGDAVWEQTIRIWPLAEDRAMGVVLLWGFLDDAVAGKDFRVHLRRTGGSWAAEAIEERFHCARRVTEDGDCA